MLPIHSIFYANAAKPLPFFMTLRIQLMLREIHPARCLHNTRRRWFSDADMDLFVWLDSQMPVRFQLTWNKREMEQALSWDRNAGFILHQVDAGEYRVTDYKMTPLLSPAVEETLDAAELATRFLRASDHIDPTLADFIYARLLEYPRQSRPHANQHTVVTGE